MGRKPGSILARGPDRWLVRVFQGFDGEKDAQKWLNAPRSADRPVVPHAERVSRPLVAVLCEVLDWERRRYARLRGDRIAEQLRLP